MSNDLNTNTNRQQNDPCDDKGQMEIASPLVPLALLLLLLLSLHSNLLPLATAQSLRRPVPPLAPNPLNDRDSRALQGLQPLREGDNIMFWRLQKVGSSTLLSILLSYGFRYQFLPRRKAAANSFCRVLGSAALSVSSLLEETADRAGEGSLWQGSAHFGPPWAQDPTHLQIVRETLQQLVLQEQQLIQQPQQSRWKLSAETAHEVAVDIRRMVPGGRDKAAAAAKSPLPLSTGADLPLSEAMAMRLPYKIVLTHELCNANSSLVRDFLRFAFPVLSANSSSSQWNHRNSNALSKPVLSDVRQLFLVRDPLARALSVYYFWGELFKVAVVKKGLQFDPAQRTDPFSTMRNKLNKKNKSKPNSNQKNRRQLSEYVDNRNDYEYDDYLSFAQFSAHNDNNEDNDESRRLARVTASLGSVPSSGEIRGTFKYHGNESSVPPEHIAVDFATRFPYHQGMPGPSLSWSAFANDPEDAIARIESDELMSLVLERLDESLVVMRHYLKWSLADVVVTKHRKALSSHPRVADWPPVAVDLLRQKLQSHHEYAVYDAVNKKLDQRLLALNSSGVDVQRELSTLKDLRQRVTEVSCRWQLCSCLCPDIVSVLFCCGVSMYRSESASCWCPRYNSCLLCLTSSAM
jgi:hypothetical protein